jgi:eukaryotic-like serine/threonine-protein kinase
VIDRALEKDPRQRFPNMSAFAAELEACLAELRRGDGTGDATMVVPAIRRHPAGRARSRWPLFVALLAALALAAIAVGFLALRDEEKKPTPVPASAPLRLFAVGSYDPPPGDGNEHGERAGFAVDGNPTTYWTTEKYDDFATTGKKGVGLVLSPRGTAATITRVTIQTDTPGFSAQLLTGRSAGRYHAISSTKEIQNGTTFALRRGVVQTYLVVWITSIPAGYAHVTEVRAA